MALGLVLVVWPGLHHLNLSSPYTAGTQTTVQTTTNPSGGKTTVETTAPEKESILEQALPSGGLLLVRVALAAASAFIAAAVTQRVLLGQFQFTAGGVALPDLDSVASEATSGLQALSTKVNNQQAVIEKIAASLAEIGEALPSAEREAPPANPGGG